MSITELRPRRARLLNREQAFAQIFNRKSMLLVKRWLRRLGVPFRDVRELSQDVFLAAHESFANYDPLRGRPDRWLNRIAVHVASHYRDRARHRLEELLPEDFDAEDDTPSPDERLDLERGRLIAIELLREMDSELSSVLLAHDFEGVSMAEIAQRRRIPISTAYKRRARAMTLFFEAAAQRVSSGGSPASTNGAGPPDMTREPR